MFLLSYIYIYIYAKHARMRVEASEKTDRHFVGAGFSSGQIGEKTPSGFFFFN